MRALGGEHVRDHVTLSAGIGEQLGQFLASQHNTQLAHEVIRGKDDFLSLVEHEMRTPVTAISSYIDILLTDHDPDPHDTRLLHEAIARATDTLRSIVDDLLDLAALESGHLSLSAVKYSPDGGHTTLTLTHDEHTVAITITDTGIGVPPEEHRHLFDRFYRASNARHTDVPGNGLGLSTVRAIVEAHHGTVTLHDPPSGAPPSQHGSPTPRPAHDRGPRRRRVHLAFR
ncbi:sensor histidine kinase [Actinoplanes sp. NPDC049681]|uniref:sensor histidine kinase n=1 Tax=Actinoplanes sp. NPDC049681 TaxID=3363905 RepID=UPI003788AFCE